MTRTRSLFNSWDPESSRFRKANWLQPKLGDVVAMLDMNVRGFRSLKAVEEETKSENPQDRRHRVEPGRKENGASVDQDQRRA
jgi:hypothetical protein